LHGRHCTPASVPEAEPPVGALEQVTAAGRALAQADDAMQVDDALVGIAGDVREQ
jgi:hypothetical protein